MNIDFELFFEENKYKLDIDFPSHPINEEAFIYWIERHHEDFKKAACFFREATKHISYDAFQSQIGKMCAEIRRNKEQFSDIVLVLTDKNVNKSNFWVSMLFYKSLRDIISNVYLQKIPNNLKRDTLVIIPDDVSYSGKQFEAHLKNLINDNVREYIHIYCAIPYISEIAVRRL